MNIFKLSFCLAISILIFKEQTLCQQKWSTINFKEKFKDTLLVSDHFVFSDYVFKDESGKWQSAMSDGKGNQIIDTTLFLIGSNCMVYNGDSHEIRFCSCSYQNDSLSVNIYDNNPAYADNIKIICSGENFAANYKSTYPTYYPGQKYIWETKSQKLKLSTDKFRKGRWLNGFIHFNVDEFFKSDTYPLTLQHIKIKGFFKCIIE
jgi:hypothetical protein